MSSRKKTTETLFEVKLATVTITMLPSLKAFLEKRCLSKIPIRRQDVKAFVDKTKLAKSMLLEKLNVNAGLVLEDRAIQVPAKVNICHVYIRSRIHSTMTVSSLQSPWLTKLRY